MIISKKEQQHRIELACKSIVMLQNVRMGGEITEGTTALRKASSSIKNTFLGNNEVPEETRTWFVFVITYESDITSEGAHVEAPGMIFLRNNHGRYTK